MSLCLHVRTLGGELHVLKAASDWSSRQAKVAIELVTGIPRSEQRLIAGCATLNDSDALQPLAVDEVAELTLVRYAGVSDREAWERALELNPQDVRLAPEAVRADIDLMRIVLRKAGSMLQYACGEVRRDEEAVLAAIRNNPQALAWAELEFRADPKVVAVATARQGRAIQHATPELRGSRHVILRAVRQNGMALQYASEELRADEEVVTAAVRQCGYALQFVAREARSKQVMLTAVGKDSEALAYTFDTDDAGISLSDKLLRLPSGSVDDELVLLAVQQQGGLLASLPMEFRRRRELALAAVSNSPVSLQYTTDEQRADREVVLQAVRRVGWTVRYANPALQSDREVALAAVQSQYAISTLEYLPSSLRADRQVVLAAVQRDERAFRFASPELQLDAVIRAAAGLPPPLPPLSRCCCARRAAPGCRSARL